MLDTLGGIALAILLIYFVYRLYSIESGDIEGKGSH